MGKLFSIIGGLIAIGILVFLILSSDKQGQNMDMMANMRLPEFSLQNYEGQTITPASFAGRPLVINSWAAWCPFCREELRDFAKVKKEFGDKLEIVAIDRAESLTVAKKYSDELGVTNDFVFLLDPGDSFYQSLGGFSMPETIFVDKNGNIVFHKRGPMKLEEIRRRVQDNFGI